MRTTSGRYRHLGAALVAAIAFASIVSTPAGAISSSGSVEAGWTSSLPVMEIDSLERAPSSVAVVDGVVHVAAGAKIARFSESTGAAAASWNAPSGVAITGVAAGPSDTIIAVGEKGANGWIGRYSSAGALPWSEVLSGDSQVAPVGVAVVGSTAYLAGNAPAVFGREVFVRRYDDIGTTPTAVWENVGDAVLGDVVTDVAATSSAVYLAGSTYGAQGAPAVWRFAAATGARTTTEVDVGSGSYLSARVTGIAADGDRLYITYQGRSRLVIGDEIDGFVARLHPTTMATTWRSQIGTTYTPGSPPTLGNYDTANDLAIDSSGIVVVGTLSGSANSAIAGLAGSGGFLARYSDSGSAGSRQYIRRTPALESVTVSGADLLVTTRVTEDYEAESIGGACGEALGTKCKIAKIENSDSAPPPPPHGFNDVPSSAFYADAVAWLKAEGITTGTSATTFSPNDPVTRGQMAAFLFRLVGEPTGSPGHGFSDVPALAFYADAVKWLKAEGITTGTSATTFAPGDTVTRGQMAAFLFRLAGEPGGSPGHGFSDVPASAFYADAVKWLKATGITTGTSATTFAPGDTVTRGQMAAFLFRYASLAS